MNLIITLQQLPSKSIIIIINSLHARKAFDPASISTTFLKQFKNELSKPISLLPNISLDTPMFPNIIKTANVTPIFKNDDPALCNNYQPISLLSNKNKKFEKIIHARLSVFLSTNNILYEKQFGFRNQHSTNHALIEITEKIKQGCDSGKFVSGVFLDFQKAFNTVNHDILLKKLEYYGIRDKSNKWLRSLLEVRMQHTTINKTRSSDKLISIRASQGSILGPILFIFFKLLTSPHCIILQTTPISCLLKTH